MPANDSRDTIEMEITAISVSPQGVEQYIVSFAAKSDAALKLDMQVGTSEASVLAMEIEQMKPTAPLPFDLFHGALEKVGYRVQEVVIETIEDGIYKAKLVCTNGSDTFQLAARAVDAVTLALKFGSPVYCSRQLLVSKER